MPCGTCLCICTTLLEYISLLEGCYRQAENLSAAPQQNPPHTFGTAPPYCRTFMVSVSEGHLNAMKPPQCPWNGTGEECLTVRYVDAGGVSLDCHPLGWRGFKQIRSKKGDQTVTAEISRDEACLCVLYQQSCGVHRGDQSYARGGTEEGTRTRTKINTPGSNFVGW